MKLVSAPRKQHQPDEAPDGSQLDEVSGGTQDQTPDAAPPDETSDDGQGEIQGGSGGIRSRFWSVVPEGRWRWAVIIAAVLVLLGSVAVIVVQKLTGLPEDAVLRVGDTVVTEQDYEQRVRLLRALYGVQPPEDANGADRFRRDAAKSIAVGLVVERAAAERDIVIPDRAAQDAIDRLVDEQFPSGRDAFLAALGTVGASERDVQAEITRQLASSRLFDEVTREVAQVTDAEVRKEFQDRREEMVTPERRRLSNIVVRTEEEARELYDVARSGADFAKLAAERSLDRSSSDKGGDLGELAADELESAYAKAAFSAEQGSVFGPVRTEYGWNVGKVIKVVPGEPLAFDQVAEQLKNDLNSLRRVETWKRWLGNELKSADVEYADDYRPSDPDAPPAGP